MNLSPEEDALVRRVQKAVAVAKKALIEATEGMDLMKQIQLDAERAKEANASMRFEGGLREVHGLLQQHHADASDALCDCFDDGGPVVFGGGGR